MIDREAFVSRLILEADTELEREAAYWLQVDGLELARLRAIVRDLAATEPLDTEFNECRLCFGDYDWLEKHCTHDPCCPWLRATQEVQPLTSE